MHRGNQADQKEDWRIPEIRKVWQTEQGKCLANVMLEMSGYWNKDECRGDYFDGMRHMLDELLFLTALPEDLIKTITQGEIYGREAN